MNIYDINTLIEEGESSTIEFKRRISSSEKIARTLISFANTKGGVILFGVDDDGSIVGVESEKSEMELIEIAGKDFCDPPIVPTLHIVPFNGKDVIVCHVDESKVKPHYFLGAVDRDQGDNTRVYIRVNANTVTASKEVVKILQNENPHSPPLKVSIGENELRLFEYLEQHQRITVRELGCLINVSDRRASRILVRLVRAGVLSIHIREKEEFFTLTFNS